MYMHLHFEYLTRQLCMGKIFLINLYPKAQNLIFLLIILPSISKRVVSHNNLIRPFKKSTVILEGLSLPQIVSFKTNTSPQP